MADEPQAKPPLAARIEQNFDASATDSPSQPCPNAGAVGEPGFWEGVIPVWGSGRAAVNDFQTGHWGWGLVNSALAVSDVFLVKALVVGAGKLLVKGAAKAVVKEGAEVVEKKAVKAAQLKLNKANGELAEKRVKAELEAEGHEVLGSQVNVKTPLTNRRVDHLIRDGKTGEVRAIEVKSGGATKTPTQVLKDAAMESKGGTITGKNAPPGMSGQTQTIKTEVRH